MYTFRCTSGFLNTIDFNYQKKEKKSGDKTTLVQQVGVLAMLAAREEVKKKKHKPLVRPLFIALLVIV